MSKLSRPRKGSLQFYPRKRTAKVLPSVNWAPINGEGILGFIAYKAGMATAVVKDLTEKSMTQKKQVSTPATILETPNMKLYSIRFYNKGIPIKDVLVSLDKELKRKVRLPKQLKNFDANIPEEYDDIRAIVYSLPKQTSVKKTPDMIEVAIGAEKKLDFVKNLIGREISIEDFLKYKILDVRGVTTGRGLQGPVKRFGITLKSHKSEKGVRRPGSLAPWHPARVTFRTPMAGQLGFFKRTQYNLNVLSSGKISDTDINLKQGFPHYGKINSSYIILKGSVQGPKKRQILLTPPLRPSKEQSKKKYEFLELITK